MLSVVLQVTEEHWSRASNLSSKAPSIDSDLGEILTLWNNLDESARRDLLGGGSAAEQRGDRAVELKISFPEVLL
jgi:hypothetical protein